MGKFAAVLVACTMLAALATGCEKQEYQDGIYSAEFESFDTRGYKDFMELTVENGEVTGIVYDAVNAEGDLKSADEQYRTDMEAVQNNYPEQVHSALKNQYLVAQDIEKIDAVAGATYTTDCFLTLFKALEENIYAGDTTHLVVENAPMK